MSKLVTNSFRIFSRILLTFIGIAAFGWLLLFPQIEGRNANSNFFSLYFNDPFLVYVYLGAIPFFIGIFQAYKLIRYFEQRKGFSNSSMDALRIMRYCAIASIGFIIGAVVILVLGPEDDKPPIIGIGVLLVTFYSLVAIAANFFQKYISRRTSK